MITLVPTLNEMLLNNEGLWLEVTLVNLSILSKSKAWLWELFDTVVSIDKMFTHLYSQTY